MKKAADYANYRWQPGRTMKNLIGGSICYGSQRGDCACTPDQKYSGKSANIISVDNYKWKKYSRGLSSLPIAA